jgi:heterodisulfide reductase subunit C
MIPTTVKTTTMDHEPLQVDPEMRSDLWKCHQCGQCSSICPSYHQDGIRTRWIMELVLMDGLDAAEEKTIWLCTMCNSCTERCQLGVDPAGIIADLRNMASRRGNIPEHFRKEAQLFKGTGLAFPVTGLTRKLRKELDLPPLEVSETAMKDLGILLDRTTLGGLDID